MKFIIVYAIVSITIVGALCTLLLVAHLALKPDRRSRRIALALFLALAALPTLTGWGPFS